MEGVELSLLYEVADPFLSQVYRLHMPVCTHVCMGVGAHGSSGMMLGVFSITLNLIHWGRVSQWNLSSPACLLQLTGLFWGSWFYHLSAGTQRLLGLCGSKLCFWCLCSKSFNHSTILPTQLKSETSAAPYACLSARRIDTELLICSIFEVPNRELYAILN